MALSSLSPENDNSQGFKVPYFATCLHRVGSLKKHISEQSEWAWPEVTSLDVRRLGLLLVWNSFSLAIPAEHNNLAKTTQKCLWCSRSPSLMVLSNLVSSCGAANIQLNSNWTEALNVNTYEADKWKVTVLTDSFQEISTGWAYSRPTLHCILCTQR